MVTPSKGGPSESEENTAMLHTPTATSGGGLTHASPLRPTEPTRYSLGKQGNEARNKPPRGPGGGSAPPSHSNSGKLRKLDPNAYKVFLLLLQPQSKIFELIQLIYEPQNTTVGDIIEMIPSNATEPALGSQDYLGLCRPKTQEELLDKNMLASESRPGIPSAKISLGEILVAIPEGFSGTDVSSLSKQILSNPKIVKLLKRADPLAPKSKRRSSRRQHRHSTNRARSAEQVHVLERHDEEPIEESFEMKLESERLMKQAMAHAAAEAAAANAAVEGGGRGIGGRGLLASFNSESDLLGEESYEEEFSQQESIDESFSSWSKSFDASFSAQSSICSGVSKRAIRRKDRQAKRLRILQRSAVAAFGLMIMFYVMDPHKDDSRQQHVETTQNPMGLMGCFQCFFLLLTLYKVERLVRTTHAANKYQKMHGHPMPPSVYMSEDRRCPFLKASGRALKRFKAKYAKRLQRAATNTSKPERESKQLRRFSLKAAGFKDHGDTGSL